MLYSDGACSGNPGPGGWGAVVVLPEGRVKELGGGERPTTNNRMEMTAALRALEAVADRPEPAVLYTDSAYVVDGVTRWVAGWRRRGWKTAAGGDVLNRDLWEALSAAAAARKGRLSWERVRGHAGHEGNERCDRIAVGYSRGPRQELYDGPLVGCGYSVLEPGPEHRAAPREPGSRPSKKTIRGGWYLSLVGGKVERHTAWPQCQARVHGVSGARFKKVADAEAERAQLAAWGVGPC
ncbi:MAG: ribonuclease HI [Elusimicrobia bacterium]|nr:ribonuclease HI [Elusimicrobiota bacterium]